MYGITKAVNSLDTRYLIEIRYNFQQRIYTDLTLFRCSLVYFEIYRKHINIKLVNLYK